MWLRQMMPPGCATARAGPAHDGRWCWRMKRSGMLLARSGCGHLCPPGAAHPTSLSFKLTQREAKGFAEPEEERRSL